MFINSQNEHRFLVRGAIAKGKIQHGESVPKEACPYMGTEKEYKKQLLFGMPMIQACESEKKLHRLVYIFMSQLGQSEGFKVDISFGVKI